MAERVYLCKCSQDININGHEIHDHLCKKSDELTPYPIVSCFSGYISREDVLTSPTLMINLHHSIVSEEIFHQLIESEKLRAQFTPLSSWIFKIKPEVTVISKDKELLDDFINTYGGILNIKPVWLKKIFSPDIITGEVVSIDGKFNQYKISVQTPYPIDIEKCTFCGLCNKECPTKCIDENLNLFLDNCNYCGICEDKCPEGAIDIHRYNVVDFETPQFIIDKDIKLDLPADKRGIFYFSDFKNIFKNIGEFEVTEFIVYDKNLCQYHAGFDKGCKLCFEKCRANAITKDQGLQIDHFVCNNCGECVAVCPTGALQYAPFTDKDFLQYFDNIDIEGLTLVFANEDSLKAFHWGNIGKKFNKVLFIEHTNPNAINELQYLYLFLKGVRRVIIKTESEELSDEAKLVNYIINELFEIKDFVSLFDSKCLDNLQGGLMSGILNQTVSIDEYKNRRYMFSQIMKILFEHTDKKDINFNDISERFSNISCDNERCSLCLACVNVCKTGAMIAEPSDFSLRLRPSDCINCYLCIELCPEKVLNALQVATINKEFFETKIIAQDEPLRCERCGKVFGNKRVFDEVKRRLIESGLFYEKGRFLHLCEDCRVVAMFEDSLSEG